MTVDDDNSIYVGGLPYSATEDTIRRVFGPYGAIVAIKMINDHKTRGKCYCFVTFRNPRSVVDAIGDMDGKTIDGRVVRVNEVTTRGGGRSNFSRERFQRNAERGVDWDRGRDRERDYYDRDRDRYQQRHSDRSRERARSWDHDGDGDRRRYAAHDHNHARDGDQSKDGVLVENELEERRIGDWNGERGLDLLSGQDRKTDGTNCDREPVDFETDQLSRKLNDSRYNDQHRREISSDSSDDFSNEVEERLERAIERRDELKKEISQTEKKFEDKQQFVSNLQKRTQMLEDALITAKKCSSQHRMQLTELHKCFLQVKECSERLKSCEQELQSLVDSAVIRSDLADDVG